MNREAAKETRQIQGNQRLLGGEAHTRKRAHRSLLTYVVTCPGTLPRLHAAVIITDSSQIDHCI